MGTRPEASRLCRAPWLLGFISLLLSAFSTGVRSSGARGSGVEDSRNLVSLKGTQGGSVVFHVTRRPEVPPEAKLEKISWAVKNESNYILLLHVSPGVDVPEWVNPQDKFKERLHVPNTTTLRIDKLTLKDSGWYRARCSFSTGIENAQYFHLSVYEPVPRPQVLEDTLSLTRDWCNVTLECNATGTTGAVNVSWESKGLPRELEQREAPGPAPNPWTLALNLPLNQPSPSITCVVSNPVDQKTATRDLGEVCVHERETRPHGQAGAAHLGAILGALAVALLVLGAGLYLRCSHGKRKSLETGRGAGSQEKPRDHDGGVLYAELSRPISQDGRDKGSEEPHLVQESPLTTVYSVVRTPGQVRMEF
ncbi:CD48 antigen-like [Crocuta crocuta]